MVKIELSLIMLYYKLTVVNCTSVHIILRIWTKRLTIMLSGLKLGLLLGSVNG